MTFATRGNEIHFVDGGIRVRRRQNFVVAVATRAIGRHGGTILRSQTVVAVKKCFHAVRRQIVLRIQPLGSVAAAAHILGNAHRRTTFQRTNLVIVMATRAGRRILRAGRHRLAVNAHLPVAHFLVVTRAARFCLPRKIKRRRGRTFGNNRMRIMTIAAGSGIGVTGFQRKTVNARVITFCLPRMAK